MIEKGEELKRCPFCGKKVYITRGLINAPFWFFECENKNCGAVISFNNDVCNRNPPAALICWNRREG